MSDIDHLLVLLANGSFDDRLDHIEHLLEQRRDVLIELRVRDLEIGDKVRLVSTISPQYLAGTPGEIVGRNGDEGWIFKVDPVALADLKRRNRGQRYISGAGTIRVRRDLVEPA